MRILVIRLRSIGDMLLSTPAISLLAKHIPDSRITVLSEALSAPMVQNHGSVHSVMVLDRKALKSKTSGLKRLMADFSMASWLSSADFDMVVDLYGGPRSAAMSLMTGSPLRIGFQKRWRSCFYTHAFPEATGFHTVAINLNLAMEAIRIHGSGGQSSDNPVSPQSPQSLQSPHGTEGLNGSGHWTPVKNPLVLPLRPVDIHNAGRALSPFISLTSGVSESRTMDLFNGFFCGSEFESIPDSVCGGDTPCSGGSAFSNHSISGLRERLFKKTGFSYCVIHGGARFAHTKGWPTERFTELARRVHSEYGLFPILVGTSDEADILRSFVLELEKRNISYLNLAGRLELGGLAALCSGASLFIGNDSGPMHIAASQNCPVVGLFGPSDPVRWGPWSSRGKVVTAGLSCSPCPQINCATGRGCMAEISIDMAWKVVAEAMNEANSEVTNEVTTEKQSSGEGNG
ncbi:MAG: hypothetical protein CVV64_06985 [Candidatus Wallbacteria bacterium HGW-Wallbacteria-1]|jgi:ADP-heptose:LPS heptosyltransferase|uniref:Glycosyltransferase family 9 protein n=1 Tax=Candidatus Wallbacteria bacterium HGW-Wallbacteria-1 TaxID=2013854 RepID=A0A2N1PT31_9BACT|nr:MAG: hypothetical protein CVV64_06985 [Candidatus Wallbacteria bacterium HGW-Wallbacteria-1]